MQTFERKKHIVQVVPEDGPTLLSDTKREWQLGKTFKVLASNYLPFCPTKQDRHPRITIEDVHSAEHYYDIWFSIEFTTKTVSDHFTDLAENDFAVEDNLNFLTKGQ